MKTPIKYVILTDDTDITFILPDGSEKEVVSESALRAYVSASAPEQCEMEESSIPAFVDTIGKIFNLPAKAHKTVYIVSETVRKHPSVKERFDVASLYGEHYDLEGRKCACGLIFNC